MKGKKIQAREIARMREEGGTACVHVCAIAFDGLKNQYIRRLVFMFVSFISSQSIIFKFNWFKVIHICLELYFSICSCAARACVSVVRVYFFFVFANDEYHFFCS